MGPEPVESGIDEKGLTVDLFAVDGLVMKTFILGNCLRGYFEGDFLGHDHAWNVLTSFFVGHYPGKRHVSMCVKEENKYGYEQRILCRNGITP